MRIDQYLWCLRYFKSRNIASNACKKGQVKINGQVVKASREVLRQDQLTIRKDQINYQCTVLDIPKSRLGAKLVDIYRMDTTPRTAFEKRNYNNCRKITIERKEKDDLQNETGAI